jgi:hypothetical protein
MTDYAVFVCYQCEANELSAPVGTVHPLCEECGNDFDDWFSKQLSQIEGRASQPSQAQHKQPPIRQDRQ